MASLYSSVPEVYDKVICFVANWNIENRGIKVSFKGARKELRGSSVVLWLYSPDPKVFNKGNGNGGKLTIEFDWQNKEKKNGDMAWGGGTNERPGFDNVTWGPVRGLKKITWKGDRYICRRTSRLYERIGLWANSLKTHWWHFLNRIISFIGLRWEKKLNCVFNLSTNELL